MTVFLYDVIFNSFLNNFCSYIKQKTTSVHIVITEAIDIPPQVADRKFKTFSIAKGGTMFTKSFTHYFSFRIKREIVFNSVIF